MVFLFGESMTVVAPNTPTTLWADSNEPRISEDTRTTAQGDTRTTAQGDTRTASTSASNKKPLTTWTKDEDA